METNGEADREAAPIVPCVCAADGAGSAFDDWIIITWDPPVAGDLGRSEWGSTVRDSSPTLCHADTVLCVL